MFLNPINRLSSQLDLTLQETHAKGLFVTWEFYRNMKSLWPLPSQETLSLRALAHIQQSASASITLKKEQRGKSFCKWKVLQFQWKLFKK